MIKTCKECSNYRGLDTKTGRIRCAIFDNVTIKRMSDCKFTNTKVCMECGRPAWTPYFWKGRVYCSDCFNRLFLETD